MEAPEKIYLATTKEIQRLDSSFVGIANSDPRDIVEPIEYTRTDAFIEGACEWLKENFSFDEAGYCKTNIYSTESMIYNFKNTLGGKL